MSNAVIVDYVPIPLDTTGREIAKAKAHFLASLKVASASQATKLAPSYDQAFKITFKALTCETRMHIWAQAIVTQGLVDMGWWPTRRDTSQFVFDWPDNYTKNEQVLIEVINAPRREEDSYDGDGVLF